MRHAQAMLTLLLPRYTDEGKFYFTLAVGCTGGRHRSVAIAQSLAQTIEKQGYAVTVRHRDMVENAA
jgi:UPF0042 nucleotide-binding protein